ncbi:hypothetical protein BpHYR1_052440 [Brachionus plicatilis]|uniref:Uncharacterized protein n=1 Tax=Brachionus plicatilis TaxID=10195 RepID=A0A3M7QY57_BRAPC|nr:hypothetical protein BpHYR1_052440 [Brachionus plicatilis]
MNDDDFADVDDSEDDSDNEFEVCSDVDDDEVERHKIKRVTNSATTTTPPSSKKLINSDRKKCQIRLCNENKFKFTCNDCGKTTCGTCLHEMAVRAMCKRCHDSKSK